MEHRVLQSLSADDQRAVLASARRRRFTRDEVIFHEGDPGDTIHLIAKGRVAAETVTPMGETVIVNVLGPGDSFGELALVDPSARRGATVRALEATETLSLSHAAFDELRRKEPAIDQFLLVLLATQVTGLNERLREAYFEPVDTRVLRCLARLAAVYDSDGDQVTVPLKQDTIASMVGATRPSVNRVLRDLEGEGVLSLGRSRMELLQVDEITRRAR